MFTLNEVNKINLNKNKINLPTFEINNDTTAYYLSQKNELLNNRYLIIGECGKGIFSTVVKALDTHSNIEVAIKIIRSIDIMLISGEKEMNILKKLNDLDTQSIFNNI